MPEWSRRRRPWDKIFICLRVYEQKNKINFGEKADDDGEMKALSYFSWVGIIILWILSNLWETFLRKHWNKVYRSQTVSTLQRHLQGHWRWRCNVETVWLLYTLFQCLRKKSLRDYSIFKSIIMRLLTNIPIHSLTWV